MFQEGGPAVKKLLEKMIEEREQRKLEIRKIVKEIQQKEEEIKRHHQREKEKFLLAVSTVMDKWNHQAKDEGLLNCYVVTSSVITCNITMVVCRRRILRISFLKEIVVSVVRILKHTLQHHSFPSPPFLIFFPGGVLPSRRLMGMCRWMGSHFHGRIDYVVAFLLKLLEWDSTFSGFGRSENSGRYRSKNG